MAVIQAFSSILSFPYDSVLREDGTYDREFDASDFALDRATFLSDGIFVNPSDNFQVRALNGNMTVTIGQEAKPNTAFIRGHSIAAKGTMVIEAPTASTQYGRIDIVTIRHSNLPEERRSDIFYRAGTPSASPAAPALIRNDDEWEIQLAQITVPANAAAIQQSNVQDTRLNTNLCGIVAYLGTPVDTTEYFTQFTAIMDQYRGGDHNRLRRIRHGRVFRPVRVAG